MGVGASSRKDKYQCISHIMISLLTVLAAKIPPRVNQTAHWMSCTDIFKKYGYPKSFVIFLSQAVFGTIDEVILCWIAHVTSVQVLELYYIFLNIRWLGR